MSDAGGAGAPRAPADVAAGGPATSSPRHRVRRAITWVLVVMVALLVPLSVVTVWTVTTVTNTDRYVTTVAPIAEQQVVTSYIALEATNRLFDEVQVQQRIAGVLPQKAGFIAAPVTAELRSFVQRQITQLLQSQRFATFWVDANRKIHGTLVKFLKGEPLPKVEKARDVAINLTPILQQAISALDRHGVTVFDPAKAKLDQAQALNFSLASQPQVQKARTAFRYLSDLGWLVPLVTLVLLGGVIAVAVDRRKSALRAVVGAALGVLLFLGALALVRSFFISHGSAPTDVTATLFDQLSRFLYTAFKRVLLVCVVLAALLWLLGPARWAVWARTGVGRALRWVARQLQQLFGRRHRAAATAGARRSARWCLEHRAALRLLGAVVAGLVLVADAGLSDGGVVVTLVVLVVYLGVLELVLAWARRISASSPTGDPDAPPVVGGDPPRSPPAAGTGADGSAPATRRASPGR